MSKLIVAISIALAYLTIGNAFNVQPRIINGFKANSGQFPYFAHLLIMEPRSSNLKANQALAKGCGATLISDQWLLTAAHCLATGKNLTAYLGTTTRAPDHLDPGHLVISVDRNNFYIHPNFTEVWNDIALIKLPQRVKFTSQIKPAQLSMCSAPENVEAVHMGTGIFNTSLKEVTQNDLKDLEFAVLKTLPPAVCQNAYRFLEWSENFICAYDSVNHQATCQGDSGGPLMLGNTVIGVSNFVSQESLINHIPQAFASVYYHMKWIKKTTGLKISKTKC